MKRATAIITVLLAALLLSGCATAKAEQEDTDFQEVAERAEHHPELLRERILAYHEVQESAQSEQAEDCSYDGETWDYSPYDGYDESLNNNPAYLNGGIWGNENGLNSFNGVYDYNGHHETFYASHAVYDDQLWVDDDGFFRDDQGRYVVASSDYADGTEIEISQGTAVVMDDGPESGTVDVHTTWGR